MSFTVRDAVRLYGIDGWGNGYFDVDERGHLTVRPNRDESTVDLFHLVPRLKAKKHVSDVKEDDADVPPRHPSII